MSTQVPRTHEAQFVDLQDQFGRHFEVLLVFVFNRVNYDVKLTKSYVIPIPVFEQDNETTVTRKSNKLFTFKFGDVHSLEKVFFLVKCTKVRKSKRFSVRKVRLSTEAKQ